MSDERHIRLVGSHADTFEVLRFSGTEELGRPFQFVVELLATDDDLDFPQLLGSRLSLVLGLEDGEEERYFDGCIVAFSQNGRRGRRHLYTATLRPQLWYLTLTNDCRIFQQKNTPDIISEILDEHGYSDVENLLTASYEAREYCVQYRESDFDFISRLMEEEGIYYFFRHEEGKHTLVLADSTGAHEVTPGCEEVAYLPVGAEDGLAGDHVWDWWLGQEVQTETYKLRDYDFTNPGNPPEATETRTRPHEAGSFEVYDYPGRFTQADRGAHLAVARIEARDARFEQAEAIGNLRAVAVGGLLGLTGHPRDDQNREYLVTRTSFRCESADYETGSDGTGDDFECRFTAISSDVPFRPARLTPRPLVHGPQTATVVGPGGEDVWTDEFGRVKCQFHWDRVGVKDENSSCWLRVSQISAGDRWGSMFMPHVDQEVIVSFLEGDPDRPIVTGRVYNADNMPACPLPDHQYCSVIKDHYGNAMVFNGTPGKEHISLYSPSHDSLMVLGRSFKRQSKSDDWEKTYGDTFKVTFSDSIGMTLGSSLGIKIGNEASFFVGSKLSASLALNFSIDASVRLGLTMGPEVSGKLVTSYSFGKSQELKSTKDRYRRDTQADMILDAAKEVVLGGGAGKGNRSLLISDNRSMKLAFGQETPPPQLSKVAAYSFFAAGLASGAGLLASVEGGVRGMKASLEADQAADRRDDNCCDRDVYRADGGEAMKGAAIASGVGALASGGILAASVIGFLKTWKSEPVPSLATETANVVLEDNKVQLWAGTGRLTEIVMDKKDIKLIAEKDVVIETKGDVKFNKLLVLGENAGVMKVSAKIDHKNLKVT
ncbi:type VI secretion system VgrG family protein [Natronocella acetinitrilica]|uniref:Type VI secretion system VgrG family protein n=1 Tax=Natronocella acetinitrilica TaxID=414046 RepID=A0AAE3KAW9_9GAMM|nr:type VI secretion system tip protein TssI/VgrG [Natronocella acetinitrilica]MCP1673941.1 type VI secretion system VgrG family protein [Natronocella acetinitrilica]